MALAAVRPLFCRVGPEKPDSQRLKVAEEPPPESGVKIVLQPRVCTLRSYGGDRGGVMRVGRKNEVSHFFETLSDYVESSKKSHDFEIISGRLAMIVFAATLGVEIVTGNSVFRKVDLVGIEEAGGICLAAVTSAAVFAWFSSNRSRVDRILTVGIDSLIDNIIDGLFYDSDSSDWSDEI